jgi:phosphate transport system permease protein
MTPPSTNIFVTTSGTRRRIWKQRAASCFFGALTVAVLIPLMSVIATIFINAWPALSLDFLLDVPRNGMRDGGLWPAFIGTLHLVVIALTVAAPVGVLAGIYLNEYAGDTAFSRIVQLAVVNLAGVPSIVYALFGVGAFVITADLGKCILAASFTMAIMTLPVYIVATKEALSAVPMNFRIAAWNLGASKWQTIRTIVLPNSISGILTGIILDTCRTVGETAPILFTGAVFFKRVERGDIFPYHLTEQCMALSTHLYTMSTQVPGVKRETLFAIAAVLLSTVLMLNGAGIIARTWLRTRRKW